MGARLKSNKNEFWEKLDALLVIGGITSGLVGNYDSPAGEVSKIIPATYAFAIWAPIYISGTYFAWCLLRRRISISNSGVHLLALSFFLSGLWVRFQNNNLLELIIVAINFVVVLAQGNLLSKISFRKRSEFLAIEFPSSTLAGWLTLATAVTFSDGLNISYGATSTGAIFSACAIGFAISAAKWIVPTLTYRVTLIWGLAGIIVQQYGQAKSVATVSVVGVAVLLGLIGQTRLLKVTRS